MHLIRILFIILALFSLFLGGIGIILPGLPTTPFVLLSAALFLRSSDTLYNKLLESRLFGAYLKNYMNQKGMTLRQKISSILLMWTMISISISTIANIYFTFAMILTGLTGTGVMGFAVKTVSSGSTPLNETGHETGYETKDETGHETGHETKAIPIEQKDAL